MSGQSTRSAIEEKLVINWILKTYSSCHGDGKFISVSKLTADANHMLSTTLPSKENHCPLKEHELGRIVKLIFPEVKKVKKSVSLQFMGQNRETVYDGLCVANSTPRFSWCDVKKYSSISVSANKWAKSKVTDELVEWINVLDVTCNGERLVKSLVIFENLSFKFFIGSHEVKSISDETVIPSLSYLNGLFMYLSNITICSGFPVELDKKTTDRAGNVVGVTESWSNMLEAESLSLRHRAVECAGILTSHEKMCHRCSTIKHNSYYKNLKKSSSCKENEVLAPQRRESYMTVDELREKLHQEKKKRISCERRERSKQEIIDDMKTFTEEDNDDFRKMFANIDEEKLDPDLKMFWDAQKKAMEMKDLRGNRWHPK